ncbi:hypothetical protein ACWDKQ_28575 [Saccharopolyspora sp. NPDC000995]
MPGRRAPDGCPVCTDCAGGLGDSTCRRYLENRLNLTTAGGVTNPFLFPGRRAGQPLHTTSLRLRLRNLGLPSRDDRTATIRQLVLQAPAPVVAGMLGYHPNTTLAAEAGATWTHYAPGDHGKAFS